MEHHSGVSIVSLTGKTRFRTGLFGKLILQVQETRKCSASYNDPWDDDRTYNIWRDATTQDVLRGDLAISEVFDAKSD